MPTWDGYKDWYLRNKWRVAKTRRLYYLKHAQTLKEKARARRLARLSLANVGKALSDLPETGQFDTRIDPPLARQESPRPE